MRTLVKSWLALLLVAALMGFVTLSAVAEDPVIARVNGVDIKKSDLDFAASEVGSGLANYMPEDRKKMLVQYRERAHGRGGRKRQSRQGRELCRPGEILPAARAA
jgi:hypothetical protein